MSEYSIVLSESIRDLDLVIEDFSCKRMDFKWVKVEESCLPLVRTFWGDKVSIGPIQEDGYAYVTLKEE